MPHLQNDRKKPCRRPTARLWLILYDLAYLQVRLQRVGEEPVLRPTHELVRLLGQTESQDLEGG